MRFEQQFTIHRSAATVWAFLADPRAVGACLPGAEVTAVEGATVTGRVAMKLGPFQARFDGDAILARDDLTRTGTVTGRGVDKRGGSRSQATLTYRVEADGDLTRVAIQADIVLSGPIAQFGRTGLITETADLLIADFATNLEAALAQTVVEPVASPGAAASRPVSLGRLLLAMLKARLARLLRGGRSNRDGSSPT